MGPPRVGGGDNDNEVITKRIVICFDPTFPPKPLFAPGAAWAPAIAARHTCSAPRCPVRAAGGHGGGRAPQARAGGDARVGLDPEGGRGPPSPGKDFPFL